jgi:hypothetical protein
MPQAQAPGAAMAGVTAAKTLSQTPLGGNTALSAADRAAHRGGLIFARVPNFTHRPGGFSVVSGSQGLRVVSGGAKNGVGAAAAW